MDPNKNKEIAAEIKDRISDLKDRIKKMSETEKKSLDETLKIVEEILDYNKFAQKMFSIASKVGKRKSEPKLEESIAKSLRLRRVKIKEMKEKKT